MIKKYTPSIPVPTKQWQMLELGLADLAQVEANPAYSIDMARWHQPVYGNDVVKCSVCLAGAVMAGACETPIDVLPALEEYPEEWQHVFCRLDVLRCGWYRDESGDHSEYITTDGFDVAPYIDNPAFWRTQMIELMNFLKERDL